MIITILAFAAGSIFGSVVTFIFCKTSPKSAVKVEAAIAADLNKSKEEAEKLILEAKSKIK